MEIPDLTSILTFVGAVIALFYATPFVLFAFIRIIWGVSIQRPGWLGVRRISFTPRDGLRVDVRGLRLSPHVPTFAQPTWCSVVIQELKVTIDPTSFGVKPRSERKKATANGSASSNAKQNDGSHTPRGSAEQGRSRTWRRLTDVKNQIKRLHRKIHLIRTVDLVATNTTLVITDVGSVQIGSFTMAVDTRAKTVDRSRLFQHKRPQANDQRPAEWMFSVRSIFFTPEGRDSSEILDHCTLNVHGLLHTHLEGLRDATITLKLGRLSLPYDDIERSMSHYRRFRKAYIVEDETPTEPDLSLEDVIDELEKPGSREQSIVQTVSDSKEFIASILRGIQEIEFAIGFFGFTTRLLPPSRPTGAPVYLNLSMKEFGLDLLRLDSSSPAHRMYFSPEDVAHQALLSAIAVSVGIDDGHERPERLLYIPMVTATAKSTLPAKSIQYAKAKDDTDWNKNILFANLVVTSPSTDLDPKHLPLLLTILKLRKQKAESKVLQPIPKRHLISRLLPKASIKVSVHEPVIRVSLPPMEKDKCKADDFDLLISSMTSISLDIESSHSADGQLHYSLASNLRITSHELYYQTALSQKHNLLLTDTLELKLQLSASPSITVSLTGDAKTFSVFMVRPEISEGVRQIVVQVRRGIMSELHHTEDTTRQPSFLRRLPPWLAHVSLQGSDFNFEVAGVEEDVSRHARGVALQLESWTAEYKAHKSDGADARLGRRRVSNSRSGNTSDAFLKPPTPATPRRKKETRPTDGRRLAVHLSGLEGFVIESEESWEPDPFWSLPRFEVAFSTSSDQEGPVMHINSFAKSLYINMSLYRYFAIGVATMVVRRMLFRRKDERRRSSFDIKPEHIFKASERLSVPVMDPETMSLQQREKVEIVTVDFKAGFIQVKTRFPADPPMMLHLHSLESGRHRWALPFFRTRLARLYVESPTVKTCWARIVSMKGLKVDLREARRQISGSWINQKSIDVFTEATRFGVPHQLTVHRIFDNVTNVVKTTKQLHHRFKTDTDEYILNKGPEGPKQVPKISYRSHTFIFELEDSSFEWKLGTIYRYGLLEQKQRVAREEAFRMKVKKLEQEQLRKNESRYRTRSANHGRHRRGRSNSSQPGESVKPRSRSVSHNHSESNFSSPGRGRQMRYDTEGQCDFTKNSKIQAKQAWDKLQRLNAQTWKKRIDRALTARTRDMRDIRTMFWGVDEFPETVEHNEKILAIPQRPGLMCAVISDLGLTIDAPSFPIKDYAKFMHRIGKGMPTDMRYSLLIPMNGNLTMGEARVTLRDYPLPLLHVPAIRPGQSPRLPSLSLKADFVLAEEFRDGQSTRHVNIVVVPPDFDAKNGKGAGFAVDIPRTVSAVKTYSDMNVAINSGYSTRITWGTSYQPAIQDMMQVIEGFTKPTIDPSERVGFWDKIRLSFHSRVNVAWKGDGDVHLVLKGSRDPYYVTGHGAGFVMCWRNDVRWSICQSDDPKKFMTVDSGDYVLAIPDFNHYARQQQEMDTSSETSTLSSTSSFKNGALFKKVIMKLSGNVQWLAGLVFERNLDGGGRSFDFKPHYEVVLRTPNCAKSSNGLPYDAFRGFRSHHIHMSVAIAAPVDRDWSLANLKPSSNYNSVHLTPRFFTHFYSWWSMFSGVMSLPVRQGKLFPGVEKSSKKFGRHLATIKYNLLLSPLFISHIYKHKDAEDYGQGVVSATGLKLRLDSFMLDLHQRREEFRAQTQGPNKQTNTTGMRINAAQLDFISADIRAVSASITGTTTKDLDRATDETLASYQQPLPQVDMSKFTIPDNDLTWIDMDDFVELDWILPAEPNPETNILPLAFAPRFSYFRQTDHNGSISGDEHRSSPFGNEDTHICIMSERNDPRRVQCDLLEERLQYIMEQLAQNERLMQDQELKVIKEVEGETQAHEHLDKLRDHHDVLNRKHEFLEKMHKAHSHRLDDGEKTAVPDIDPRDDYFVDAPESRESGNSSDPSLEMIDSEPFAEYSSDFNNRFIAHNLQMKWNNPLRNIILRYIHQVSQRRGFVYYMSRRAVKFILDIVEEQKKSKETLVHVNSGQSKATAPISPMMEEDEMSIQDRIQQLLDDGKKFVNAEDPEMPETSKKPTADNMGDDIAVEFTPQNTYHVRLIAPQIQLQSEKNLKAAVIITSKGMQLKVVQIMDKDRVADEVSGLVQRRFSAEMDAVQMFVTTSKAWHSGYMYQGGGNNRYGAPAGSSWPPWAPLEVIFEFPELHMGFHRVVQKTSASLRYDKYNTLRLKYNDDVSGEGAQLPASDNDESRLDHLWIDFPHVRAICDSPQYYAMYIIVLDLLLYSEPLEKVRSERLEKIMLASDFSDLSGAPEMVILLQERIRQLEEIKLHFQINEQFLDRQGWKDRISMDHDLASCEDELFFIMKAITTSQRKVEDRAPTQQSSGILRWIITASEIVWHLVREKNESLVEFQLRGALYDRTDNNDGSNTNTVEIDRILGLNLLPDAYYPNMIAPYFEGDKYAHERDDIKMLRVHWNMLEAIAGIPVMDHFEVNLYPLKVQLEREVGKKLFEYIFPGVGSEFGHGGFSPFMVKHMLPPPEEQEEGSDEEKNALAAIHPETKNSGAKFNTGTGTGTGALEHRLHPTLHLNGGKRPKSAGKAIKNVATGDNAHHFRLFRDNSSASIGHSQYSRAALSRLNRSASSESLGSSRPPSERAVSRDASTTNLTHPASDEKKRFGIHRSGSKDHHHNHEKDTAPSDDLTQMMSRASSYMTLAYVKIPSMVLCLSYKGKGQRNFEDVHDLVFRMPTLEYRNKTWSNLDLALQLKKEVKSALIRHAGAIVGNKFSSHRPSKMQQSRLREIANSSTLLTANESGSTTKEASAASSIMNSPMDGNSEHRGHSPRRSFASGVSRDTLDRDNASVSDSTYSGMNGSSSGLGLSWRPGTAGEGGGAGSSGRSISDSRSLSLMEREDTPVPSVEAEQRPRSSGNILMRQFTSKSRTKTLSPSPNPSSNGQDEEESIRKKSKLLLGGRKFLQSLPHP